jgi:hypothetical protein
VAIGTIRRFLHETKEDYSVAFDERWPEEFSHRDDGGEFMRLARELKAGTLTDDDESLALASQCERQTQTRFGGF